MNQEKDINTLNRWINESSMTVFFGGAGVSTESGLPDFRGAQGIGSRAVSFESYLTLDFMNRHPDEFYDFYRTFFMKQGIRPNAAHYKLAEMEEKGRLASVITQNVDGLHQEAGSRAVLELHGNGLTFYCQDCKTFYPHEEIARATGAFYCREKGCGGLVRPAIVLYGEALDPHVLEEAVQAICQADLILVGGSSLTVYPAAGLIHYRKPGSRLVLVNLEPTSYDRTADLVLDQAIASLFSGLEIQGH